MIIIKDLMRTLCLIILLFLTISCSTTRYIEVEKDVPIVETRVEYKDKFIYDSLYIRDSIFQLIKGDTTYIYKEKTNTRYIYKTDTLVRIDSIPYPIKIKETEIKEVNKIYWWQKIPIYIGYATILCLVLWIIIKLKLMRV